MRRNGCATAITVFRDINKEVEKYIQVLILLLVRSIFKSFITYKTSDSGSGAIRFIVELTLDLRMIRERNKKRIAKINKIYQQKGHVTIAIDGRCGSGKTTLANKLKAYFDCHIFHMDDFYLQEYQRTQERYNEPGGNVDRERFKKEVLEPLKEHQDVLSDC